MLLHHIKHFQKKATRNHCLLNNNNSRYLSSIASKYNIPEVITSFIDGKVLPVDDKKKKMTNIRPSTGEQLCYTQICDETDYSLAVSSSQRGQQEWAGMSGMDRYRILRKASDIILSRKEELAILETIDQGKPLAESDFDIDCSAACIEYFAGLAHTYCIEGKHYSNLHNGIQDSKSFAYTRREPIGVCGGISAWNYPFMLACWKSAPCLASGNSMILKPSEESPLTAVKLAEIYMEAGVPAGVFNVVQGDGSLGRMLTEDPNIQKISFTGSVDTGKHVMSSCSNSIRNVTLELGGKSPCIILKDADLEKAVAGAMAANFYVQGEVCSNGTRVFVHKDIKEEFISKLLTKIENNIKIGEPLNPEVNFGALISQNHLEKVDNYVQTGIKEGAKLLTGGARYICDDAPGGFFYQPTVFEVTDDMIIAKEEIFGPVMSILTFDDEEDLIKRCNNSDFGLAAGIFTESLEKAHHLSAKVQAGMVYVNNYNAALLEVPFGGFKQSGIGRENGVEAINYYTQTKSVYIELDGCEHF